MELDLWVEICLAVCQVGPWACRGKVVWEVPTEWAMVICLEMGLTWAKTRADPWDLPLEWDLEE